MQATALSTSLAGGVTALLLALGGLAVSIGAAATPDNAAYPRSLRPGPMSVAASRARADDMASLGKALFFDPSLSGSGAMSCASCHDPAHGFGPPDAAPVRFGGVHLDQPGLRAVPSLRYLQAVPAYTDHFFESDDEGDESVDAGPTGGLTWDGRVDRLRDQAAIPLLSPIEMANASRAAVVQALAQGPHADAFRQLFGDDVFAHPNEAFGALGDVLAAYQQTPALFYPYSSRYDDVLRGKAKLTDQEQRGLELFNDEQRGNCASCHPSTIAGDGSLPQFTDYGFIAIGVPRNPAIPANRDPSYVDLGLCGPQRRDHADRPETCGLFRTPTLRNVAVRQSFFHNGVFHSLDDAVAFYATRDTDPGRWFPSGPGGRILAENDIPEADRGNLEAGLPFGRQAGTRPALEAGDIEDIVAFLKTLTDADLAPRP